MRYLTVVLVLLHLALVQCVHVRDGYGPTKTYEKQSLESPINLDRRNFCISEHKKNSLFDFNTHGCPGMSVHSCHQSSLDVFDYEKPPCHLYGLHSTYTGLHICMTDSGSMATYHSAKHLASPTYGATAVPGPEYTNYGGFSLCPPHAQSFSVITLACVMSDFRPMPSLYDATGAGFLVRKMKNPRKYYWYKAWAPEVNWQYDTINSTLYDMPQIKAITPYKPLRMPTGGYYIDPNAEQVLSYFYNKWDKYRPLFDNALPVSLNCWYEGAFSIMCNRRQVPQWGPFHNYFGSAKTFYGINMDAYPKWFQTTFKRYDMELRGTTENSQWTPLLALLGACLALWAFVGIMYACSLVWTCFEFAHAQHAKASISPAGTLFAFTFRSMAIVSYAGYKNTLSKEGEQITATSKANAVAFHAVMNPVTYALSVLGTFLFPIYIPVIIFVGLFSLRGKYKYTKTT